MILFCILLLSFETHGSTTTDIESRPHIFIQLIKNNLNTRTFAIKDQKTMEQVGCIDTSIDKSFDDNKTIQINRFEIEKSHRGQGYGFQGLKALLNILKPRATDKDIMIRLVVWKDNIPAIELYTKMGFEKCSGKELIEGYLWMSRTLGKDYRG